MSVSATPDADWPSSPTMSDDGLDLIFRNARSFSYWQDRPVSRALLQAVYDLAKMGPTSANCMPARFAFVTSEDAKERLKPHLIEGNVHKVMSAPVTVIVAYDSQFYEKVPDLFPHAPDAKDWFTGSEELTYAHAMRNGSLQGAYLMVAARALGLDCGPMSGFNNQGVDQEFFPDGRWRSNFLCSLGYGDRDKLHPRGPRLGFDDACQIL